MTRYLMGLDAGHTVIKAAVFDDTGREIAIGARPTATFSLHPRWQERDMDVTWASAAGAIQDALAASGLAADQIAAVGIAAHGDGLYAVDADLRPVRAALLATDTRSLPYLPRWSTGPVADELLALTAQIPAAYAPAATLTWLREQEPENFGRIAHLLFCKDWLRLQLTGEVATDLTEAAAGLFDVHRLEWSPRVLELCGLTEVAHILPPVLGSTAIAGAVTESASRATGLAVGTPVVAGSHDVQATALGIGALGLGAVSAILGSFSINQLALDHVEAGIRWQARASVTPGRYLLMSTSPAGATAADWARSVLAQQGGGSVGEIVDAALAPGVQEDDPLFLPFVYGTQLDPPIGGAFTGLRGWHGPQQLFRAALEGVVLNHRYHLEALTDAGPIDTFPVRLAGGGSRSAAWTQLFADVTGLAVEVTDADEAGARGAAMLAGIGVGVFGSVDEATAACVAVIRRQQPDPARKDLYDTRYARFRTTTAGLQSAEA